MTGIELEHAFCWKVFSFVTEKYRSDTKRLRDWISQPKPNGYESLHITVSNDDGAAIEVQIRTQRMDDTAESGLASHWSYKGIQSEDKMANWMSAARHLLECGKTGQTLSPRDYSYRKFNLHGHICLFASTGWGIAGVILVFFCG